MLRLNEVKIVCRGMVFGEAPVCASLQQPDWKIEARRAELSLVIAVRAKIHNIQLSLVVPATGTGRNAIDERVAAAASLVIGIGAVSDTGNHQPMRQFRKKMFVARKPGERANSPRSKNEAVVVIGF